MNIINKQKIDPKEYELIRNSYFVNVFLLITLSLFFGLIGLTIAEVKTNFYVIQNVAVLILLIMFWVITIRNTRRAIYIYRVTLLGNLLWVLLLWEAAFLVSQNIYILVVGVLINILAFISRAQNLRKKLENARSINKTSGRLDLEKGLFYFQNKLYFNSPEQAENKERIIQVIGRILYPLGPFLGYFLSRLFGEKGVIWLYFMLTYIGMLLGATYLGVIIELRDIEQDTGKEMMIPLKKAEKKRA
jgi:hypothetical protein